ncbi:MAG: Do family serine endopeptidase [Chitinophagales bacterium]|nr:Do family serine endopeptidase [Chitinophagales bacterium]MDW8393008.1 Do family serine endopeptidase [Chitinophagales bacterium]
MKLRNLVLVALVAAVTAVGSAAVFHYFFDKEPVVIQNAAVPLAQVSLNGKTEMPTGLDFRYPAKVATPTVVHIRTTYNPTQVNRDFYNPFRDWFGEDFWMPFQMPPQQNQPRQSSGSGVIITSDGYIVTNNHVVEKGDRIEVVLFNKKQYEATLVGSDPSTDLAVIKIEAESLPYLLFGNSDSVDVGEWVLAVGNPFNLESTVTAGIVSAKGRNLNLLRSRDNTAIEAFIQTDAAVNPGNSGGALVNLRGELIGINTAIATPTGTFAGYSFAVPSNLAHKVVNDIIKYGVVQRGFLGVQIATVTSELAKKEGLEDLAGVWIDSVNAGSGAEEAGLKRGDVILKINGVTVNTAPELQEQISRHRPGDRIEVTFRRGGKIRTVTAVLKNNEGNTEVVKKVETASIESLGAEFANLTSRERKDLGVEGGVKVVSLKDGKLSRNTKIREGFIITSVDNKPVRNVEELKAILSQKKQKEIVTIAGRYPDYPNQYLAYSFIL